VLPAKLLSYPESNDKHGVRDCCPMGDMDATVIHQPSSQGRIFPPTKPALQDAWAAGQGYHRKSMSEQFQWFLPNYLETSLSSDFS
jgi:hypothetical protein